MIHVTNTAVYLAIVFLLSFRANFTAANCSNETKIIGCGGDRFVNVTHTAHQCQYQLYTRVSLPNCRVENSNDSLFWYTYTNLCQNGSIIGRFFVSIDNNGNQTCRDLPNSTIPKNTCETDYDYNRDTIIIKNLTETTVKRYICFPGSNQVELKSVLAVSYIISIEEPTTEPSISSTTPLLTSLNESSLTTTNANTITSTKPNTMTLSTAESEKNSYLDIILPSVLVPVGILIIGAIIGICYYRKRKGTKKAKDYTLEWLPAKSSTAAPSPTASRDDGRVTRLTSDRGYSVWRPVKQRS